VLIGNPIDNPHPSCYAFSMIKRNLHPRILELAATYPVVTLTGPRQSGKTTLCRMAFPDLRYVSLEALDSREYAETDPRGFLADFGDGAVIDEVQRVPGLLSYIQGAVDENPTPGRFILTGSANFSLLESVSQSLAGRTALVELLPLSLDEIRRFPEPAGDMFETILRGGYPAIHDRQLPPSTWQESYVGTYLERDVRQIKNITDLTSYQTFLGLCAGRSGQILNLSDLGSDAGITHNTVKSWLSVLEAGYIASRLPPFTANVSRRLVKAPKLHFLDSGLLCYLLGIRNPDQLRHHPHRGAIFESWVVAEIQKAARHRALRPDLSFYRDRKGSEVDLVIRAGTAITAVETKSGHTIATDFFKTLRTFAETLKADSTLPEPELALVYGGDAPQKRTGIRVVPWSQVSTTRWF
jgi:uncharacterized protein